MSRNSTKALGISNERANIFEIDRSGKSFGILQHVRLCGKFCCPAKEVRQ